MPEKTKTNDVHSNDVSRYTWILLGGVIVVLYFFGLTIPFLGPDEARYSQVAREMFERRDWVTPTLGGFHWFEKPALLYWLQIFSFKLFGVNEFAARFGPALFGLGTVFSLWILGRNVSTVKSNRFANYLALIAASTLGIVVFSRGASFDIIITFPITAALVSFYIFDQSEKTNSKRQMLSLALFYLFVGISLLAKGLIGIVFPFAIVGFYYLLSLRFPNRRFFISLIWGLALTVGVASLWYLPMYQRHGYEFINEFFIQHHFQRFTSNKYQHPQPFYFYLWVLPLMTIPWIPLFFASIWKYVKNLITPKDIEKQWIADVSSLNRFAIAWMLVPLVFFSFSGSKLPGYILPAVPASIILTAVFVLKLVQSSQLWKRLVLTIAFGTFATVVALLVFALPRFAETDSVKLLVAAADEHGYKENKIVGFHTVSHNAEFYAASRLVRDDTGKQKKFNSPSELFDEITKDSRMPVLVLVPVEHLQRLTQEGRFSVEVIKDNSELAIAAVSAK